VVVVEDISGFEAIFALGKTESVQRIFIEEIVTFFTLAVIAPDDVDALLTAGSVVSSTFVHVFTKVRVSAVGLVSLIATAFVTAVCVFALMFTVIHILHALIDVLAKGCAVEELRIQASQHS
jgi:hypothetical protein